MTELSLKNKGGKKGVPVEGDRSSQFYFLCFGMGET